MIAGGNLYEYIEWNLVGNLPSLSFFDYRQIYCGIYNLSDQPGPNHCSKPTNAADEIELLYREAIVFSIRGFPEYYDLDQSQIQIKQFFFLKVRSGFVILNIRIRFFQWGKLRIMFFKESDQEPDFLGKLGLKPFFFKDRILSVISSGQSQKGSQKPQIFIAACKHDYLI